MWNSPIMIAGIILSIFSWIPCSNSDPSGVALDRHLLSLFYCYWSPGFKQSSETRVQWPLDLFFFSNFRLITLKLIHKVQRTVQCDGDTWKVALSLLTAPGSHAGGETEGKPWCRGLDAQERRSQLWQRMSWLCFRLFYETIITAARKTKRNKELFPPCFWPNCR